MHYLYRITNQITGLIYIGYTKNIKKRWAGHRADAAQENPTYDLQRAIKEYGAANFIVEHIASSVSKSEGLKAEIILIRQYDSQNKLIGYNRTQGGETFPDEGVKKSADKRRGKPSHRRLFNDDQELQIINQYHNLLSLQQISTLYNCSVCAIIGVLERHHISRRTTSETNKGKRHPQTPETREKIDAAVKVAMKKRKKLSPEQEQEICDLYLSGLTLHQIEEQLSLSDVLIWRTLKRNDIQMRERKDYSPPKSAFPKGFVPYNKGSYKFSSEQIANIQADTRSLNQIAISYKTTVKTIKKYKTLLT
jgi:group I intron endonuclease